MSGCAKGTLSLCGVNLTRLRVQEAGIDARLGEIAGAIQETMESYEVEVDGKVLPGECAVREH